MISEQREYDYVLVLVLVPACLLLYSSSTLSYAQPSYNSTAKLSTSWINQPSVIANSSTESTTLTPILMRVIDQGSSAFVCGFYCNNGGTFSLDTNGSKDCIFGILISRNTDYTFPDSVIQFPQLVWSANRNNPVQVNATLRLSQDGDLILKSSDGTLVWSTNTAGNSVAGMNLTESGNLVLFGKNNEPIWQSFDYPTDSLVVGQRLMSGQRLTSSVSASNLSEGLYSLSVDDYGVGAYINSNPPQCYYYKNYTDEKLQYVEFDIGSFLSYNVSSEARFLKLEPDGHLQVYRWQDSNDYWTEDADLLSSDVGTCGYPLVCGIYGACSEGLCSCGRGNFSPANNPQQPNLGCPLATPISCDYPQHLTLLAVSNATYFAFNQSKPDDISVEDCRNRCLSTCSCKAALYDPLSGGSCSLINEVFSLIDIENLIASTAQDTNDTTLHIKVQPPFSNASQPAQPPHSNASQPMHSKASSRIKVVLAFCGAAIFGMLSLIVSWLVVVRKRNKRQMNETEEDFLSQVPGVMPTRYSYQNLKAATKDFSEKLGEGGFGSVYEGALIDGTKVAVKCLDGLGKVKDSFLVEVKAIGGIHHVNLVKLIGFCYEKSHRLLVYEYMANRSLDGWIFGGEQNQCLPWNARRKIIRDIAKGLAYLHEECSQKIIHLDIKSQNILLDHNFNAKISDFGLSKLIEKDQSRVVTRMRGTPGYLAPEWLSSVITEKVDVYSFGVVVLEIICGRKNIDWSKAEEENHLLCVFKRKSEEEKLEELLDSKSEDMLNHIEEAVEMMRIGAWCLQGDYTKRPSMSIVVKVLEGLVEAETNLDYDFLNPTIITEIADGDHLRYGTDYEATELQPSSLSGPR